MAFLGGLRRAFGGDVETKSISGRVLSNPRTWTVPGQPYAPATLDVDRIIRETYEFNPYIFRAVELLAGNASARRLVLREDDPFEGRVVPREEMSPEQQRLRLLFTRRANPWEVAAVFRQRLYCQYVLSSKGVFIEVIRTRAGGIWGFILLDPDRVEIVPTEQRDPRTGETRVVNPLGAFRVQKGAEEGGYDYLPPYDPKLDPEKYPSAVLWVRQPHPTVMHRGMSPLQSAALSLDLDRYARLYNRKFMQQDGRPGGVLAVHGSLSDTTVRRLEARFLAHSGFEHAGRTTVIEADKATWVDTSNHPRDMQWPEVMERMAKDAAIAMGTPMSMLGDASGRTFSNTDAEYATFWESPMLPLLRLLDAQLDVLTPGGYDDELYLVHDTSDVWILGRHRREAEDRAAADLERGAITVDDYRDATRRPRLDVPAARVLLLPPGRVAVADDLPGHEQDAQQAATAPVVGQGAAPAPAGQDRQEDEPDMPTLPATRTSYDRVAALRGSALGGLVEMKALALPGQTGQEGEQRGARHHLRRRRPAQRPAVR